MQFYKKSDLNYDLGRSWLDLGRPRGVQNERRRGCEEDWSRVKRTWWSWLGFGNAQKKRTENRGEEQRIIEEERKPLASCSENPHTKTTFLHKMMPWDWRRRSFGGWKRDPKWGSHGTRNDTESETKWRRKNISIYKCLKTVLDRSWAVPGTPLGSKKGVFRWFYICFWKSTCSRKVRFQEATWDDLGTIWVAQGGPKWAPRRV